MDLGLKGRTAIICAASSGLGRGCAMALAAEGANVVINSRTQANLEAVAAEIKALNPAVSVEIVAGSVTDPGCRQALVDAAGSPDILVNNAGGPPPGDFRDWDRDTWISALDTNMLSAIDLIRLTIDGMAERGFGRIVNITSTSVRVPIPVIGMSTAARSALTGFVIGLVPQISAKGVTINNILPGPFDTDRLKNSKEITMHLTNNAVAGRIGDPSELGATCAFLCSNQAGYINGQNIQMDGGLYAANF